MDVARHGGSFWNEVGNNVERLPSVVRADVLDAWFDPAPSVLELIRSHGPELARTSPPVDALPLVRAVSKHRDVDEDAVLVGPGSSSLIHQFLPMLRERRSRAAAFDPTYSEYQFVLTKHLGCEIIRCRDLVAVTESRAQIVCLVNPNSPTGKMIPKAEFEPVVKELAKSAIVWVDETYIEYCGSQESLEQLAAETENVIVCKSMSKVYALSGLGVAYLVGHPNLIRRLRSFQAPWSVGTLAQFSAIAALKEPEYYAKRYEETARLRSQLASHLKALGLDVMEGRINCLLARSDGPASDIIKECQQQSVYLRDTAGMGETLDAHIFRISVRSGPENRRIVDALVSALAPTALET